MSDRLIYCKNISKSFSQQLLFKDYSLSIFKGEKILIAGANGSGKSSLLKLLSGHLLPDTGTVEIMGLLTNKDYNRLKPQIALFSQSNQGMFPQLTGLENINIINNHFIKLKNNKMFDLFCVNETFKNALKSKYQDCSFGMKTILKLYLIFLADKEIILLDEPLNGLDQKNIGFITNLIKKEFLNKTIIISTHEIDRYTELDCKIYNLDST